MSRFSGVRRGKDGGGDSVLVRLSGEPGTSFEARVRHHGARIAMLLALAGLITFLFPPREGTGVTRFAEGEVASEDVIAAIGFDVPKSAADLERDRREAAEAVPPTFDERSTAGDSVASRLGRFFERLDAAISDGDTTAVAGLLRQARVNVSPAQMGDIWNTTSRRAIGVAAQSASRELIPRGMLDPAELSEITTDVVYVRRGPDLQEETRQVDGLLTSRDFYAQAVRYLPDGPSPDQQELLRLILISHLEYSLVPNVVATERDRDAARSSVPLSAGTVLQGEAIVRAADPIGPETAARLAAYEGALRDIGELETEEPMAAAVMGTWLVHVLLLSIFGLLVYFSRPNVYANYRWLMLLTLLAATYFVAAYFIQRAQFDPGWLPIAFVALPVAVLWDTRISLLLVLVLASITGVLPYFSDYGTVLIVMGGGAAAAMSVRAIRRRSETWVSIAIIAASASTLALAWGLSTGRPLLDVAQSTGAIVGNATVSALLAVGFLWVFELFTGITTDQTLLEWADPTRPLLRRLSMEAPGTYAHTINVANLAEAAASEIGANGLLCRVGVLYHDVGKMLKPHYFVENQPDGRNPHDKLKPDTSATIVREHVTEGVRLAKEEGVPAVVSQFILEHHGTQRIGFFYQKALEEAEGEVDPKRFTYPGPRPQSKESAIVMLADSCESAARAMRDPTPERFRELINTVVDGKVADGQLDEAPLTLGEVARVKEQFVTILGGVVHRRIEYPETKHLTEGNGEAEHGADPDAAGESKSPDPEVPSSGGASSARG